jgi:hypothetical protein
LWDITFQKGPDKTLAPGHTVFIGLCKEGTGKSPPYPKPLFLAGLDFLQVEPGKFYEFHAAGKTFRCLLHDFGRGAAQDEKPGPAVLTIDQHPQNLKERRHFLDLVQNDRSLE